MLGTDWLESSSAENYLGVLSRQQADLEPANHPCSKESHHHPGLQKADCRQQVERGDASLLLSTGEAVLKPWDQFWAPQGRIDKNSLEIAWHRTMKMMKGLEQGDSSDGSAWRRDGSEGSSLCL